MTQWRLQGNGWKAVKDYAAFKIHVFHSADLDLGFYQTMQL
jgi:hypothetical protein